MSKSDIHCSKWLSYVLRHRPDEVGISIDPHGWVDVSGLLEAAQQKKIPLDKEKLLFIVKTNDKQRFSLSECGKKIRANRGHSIPVELSLPALTPPDVLYHGTATRFLKAIRREGVKSMRRQHVHLSEDTASAHEVGTRHGVPRILAVDAKSMAAAGYKFYQAIDSIWLTDQVPAKYIHWDI
ncbi:RNA 2'-phosphotransferase [Endozoicomonas sp. SM1973]|uniref:Probable RNA 2'-phosphotransferase n=1 Tax=Spartinivicinus marinus TaxID=2994442 RepID=A0A853HYK0_9GAMM|nr:RNA 2'-phosphotransferase [Spartinivicinus marinus]MCX4028978.1 RNA 2'-phosphotransferase [Spartinivicinus marinus]NYZ65439.1 RNA 2'-phosphotransferase [Spartinivicinus marinus]